MRYLTTLFLRLAHATCAVVCCLSVSASAVAQNALPAIMPYDGVLDLDGVSRNGPVDMRFTLFDRDGTALWTESWTAEDGRAVEVIGGHFHVPLGQHRALSDTLTIHPLFLGLEVKAPEDAAYIQLAGRQQLDGVVQAQWAFDAPSLYVPETLTVGGDAHFLGDLDARAMRVAGALTAGDSRALSATTRTLEVRGTAQAALLGGPGGPILQTGLLTTTQGLTSLNARTVGFGPMTITAAQPILTRTNAFTTPQGRYYGMDGDVLALDPDRRHAVVEVLGQSIRIGPANGDASIRFRRNVTGRSFRKTFTPQTGEARIRGSLFNGDTRVQGFEGGRIDVANCGICLNYSDGGVARHACVRFGSSELSGLMATQVFDGPERVELVYTCDELRSGTGNGHINPFGGQ